MYYFIVSTLESDIHIGFESVNSTTRRLVNPDINPNRMHQLYNATYRHSGIKLRVRNRKKYFIIYQPNHILWVLERTVSMRWFFWAPKIMSKKIFSIFAKMFI